MEFIIKYKKVLGAAAGVIALLVLLAFVITQSQSCLTQRSFDKAKANINAAQQEANAINSNIQELILKEVEAKANVNAAEKDLERIQDEVDEANKKSDEAVNNVGVIVNRNYSNTSTDSANAARCRAFPDSPECKR